MAHQRFPLALGISAFLIAQTAVVLAAADYGWKPGPNRVQNLPLAPERLVPPPAAAQRVQASSEVSDPAGAGGDLSRPSSASRPYPRGMVREYRYGGGRISRGLAAHAAPDPQSQAGYDPSDPYGIQAAVDDAYFAGRDDERRYQQRDFNALDMAQRRERLTTRHGQALQRGLDDLKRGDYAAAVVALTLAAKLNQGDPACRIHLAQARMALGHFNLAGRALRRALQLQPKLVYQSLHLDRYYARAGTLSAARQALRERSEADAVTPEEHFLRGFVEFQLGDFAAAHAAFSRAAAGFPPRDDLTRDYLEITQPPVAVGKSARGGANGR